MADTARSDAPYADRPIGLLTRLILDAHAVIIIRCQRKLRHDI